MRPPLRPSGVQREIMPLTPGVVTSFLCPGLTMLRPSGVHVRMKCDFNLHTTALHLTISEFYLIIFAFHLITSAFHLIISEFHLIISAFHLIIPAFHPIISELHQLTTAFRPQTTPEGQSMSNRGRRNAVTTPPVPRTLSLHPKGAQRRTHTAPFFRDKGNPITHNTKNIPGKIQIIYVIIQIFPGINFTVSQFVFSGCLHGIFPTDYVEAGSLLIRPLWQSRRR